MRVVFIIFLMYITLYADICSKDIKLNAKLVNNSMLVQSGMRNVNNFREIRAKKAKTHRYMTHLVIKKGNNTLYDVSTSDSIMSFQIIKTLINNTNNIENLDTIITFNTGEQIKCSSPIKQNTLKKIKLLPFSTLAKEDHTIIDYHITHPALWKATNIDEAIKILYGTSTVTKVNNTTYTNFHPLESNATNFFVVGCGEYINFSVTPDVESIMLLASYKKQVVQYVIRVPNNNGIGFIPSPSIFKSFTDRKFTNKLRSFSSPITYIGGSKSKLEATIAIVYRLKNGKILRQDFKPFIPGCCGTEPNLGIMQIELRGNEK